MENKGKNGGGCCYIDHDELKKNLTPLQYQVTQEKGTERAFTGKYYKFKECGIYHCIVCKEQIFSSDTKYDSGSGWPAFYDVLDPKRLKLKQDLSHVGGNIILLALKPGLVRTEVSCAKCGAHLGHVFDDGPKPSGKRFCVNSASLDFVPEENLDSITNATTDDKQKCGMQWISCQANAENLKQAPKKVPHETHL